MQISVDKDLETLGGTVGLSASDLHAAGFQYSSTYGNDWRARLVADLQARADAMKAPEAPPKPTEDERRVELKAMATKDLREMANDTSVADADTLSRAKLIEAILEAEGYIAEPVEGEGA